MTSQYSFLKIAFFLQSNNEILDTIIEKFNSGASWNGKFYDGKNKYNYRIFIDNKEYSFNQETKDGIDAFWDKFRNDRAKKWLTHNSKFHLELKTKLYKSLLEHLEIELKGYRLGHIFEEFKKKHNLTNPDEFKDVVIHYFDHIKMVLRGLMIMKVASRDIIEMVKEIYWNKKIYGGERNGYSIYLNNKK